MDHTSAEELRWDDAGSEHFTGRVWFGPLSRVPDPGLNALGVMFEPGARTHWHSHPDGQVLYVVAGAGRVQTAAGDTVDVSAGDVVYSPPGELHWHGAGPTSHMMHLSLTTGGPTQWEDREVTAEEYGIS